MRVKALIIVAAILLLLIILLQNTSAVTLHMLFWEINMPQFLLLVFAALIGFVIGLLTSMLARKKKTSGKRA